MLKLYRAVARFFADCIDSLARRRCRRRAVMRHGSSAGWNICGVETQFRKVGAPLRQVLRQRARSLAANAAGLRPLARRARVAEGGGEDTDGEGDGADFAWARRFAPWPTLYACYLACDASAEIIRLIDIKISSSGGRGCLKLKCPCMSLCKSVARSAMKAFAIGLSSSGVPNQNRTLVGLKRVK